MAKEELRKKVDLAFLSAFYGGLLTEKNRIKTSFEAVYETLQKDESAE